MLKGDSNPFKERTLNHINVKEEKPIESFYSTAEGFVKQSKPKNNAGVKKDSKDSKENQLVEQKS